MSQQPSAVVFDLGKVLVDFDYSLVVRRLAARSRMGMSDLQIYILGEPVLLTYERGAMNSPQFFEMVRRDTQFEGTYEEFTQYFADIFTEIPPMIALHAELRKRRVPLFIFSNTNDIAIQHIRRNFPFFAEFDGHVLSYEHGSMKPEPALYEVVERMTGRKGGEILYVDDRPENIDTGAARGWHAVLHTDPTITRERIRAAGFLG